MEVFFGDPRIQTDGVAFQEPITFFPEAALKDSGDLPPEIHPTEEKGCHFQPPPQKLRPIRSNGRHVPDHSTKSVAASTGPEAAVMRYHGELGFLSQLSKMEMNSVSGGPEDCNTPLDLGSGSLPENGGSGVYRSAFSPVNVPAMQQFVSEMNAECRDLIERHFLETELSSSSEDDGNSSEVMISPLSHKRKRKRRKKLKLFIKNMVIKVIEKQEQMHKQLIEMIEKREKERILGEEAWQQKEIERAKKDQEARDQERSHSLALISLIENFLGHEIQILNPLETSFSEKDEVEIHNQNILISDPCSKRWPKAEVQALIIVRTALDHKFLSCSKTSVWEEVAVELSNMGYNRSAINCKEKWENINKYYRRTIKNGKKQVDNGKTSWPDFHELNILHRSRLIDGGNASQCMKNEIQDKLEV